jgi:lysine 2,3-aminomutase
VDTGYIPKFLKMNHQEGKGQNMKTIVSNGKHSSEKQSDLEDDDPGGRLGRSLPRFFRTIDHLSRVIPIPEEEKEKLQDVADLYHMSIPAHYLSLIKDKNDINDPVRRQCVPSLEEMDGHEKTAIDPLGEEKTSPVSCLVHRYPDRALLLVTNRCFMYCRHCTRKRLWRTGYVDPDLIAIKKAVDYIRGNPQIREIIISGGDPLILPTERLDYILRAVSEIPHIEAVRIGTRAPVVFPQRINEPLYRALGSYPHLWVNVQFNHPNEVTDTTVSACRKLQLQGIPVSNQSVLLKGINDDPAVMTDLCHKLQHIRVRPYYLFQCDPVVGAAHFRTPVSAGVEIIEKMRGFTGGMCIPVFVVDGIDGKGKIPIEPNYVVKEKKTGLLLRNYRREVFFYPSPERKTA